MTCRADVSVVVVFLSTITCTLAVAEFSIPDRSSSIDDDFVLHGVERDPFLHPPVGRCEIESSRNGATCEEVKGGGNAFDGIAILENVTAAQRAVRKPKRPTGGAG